MAEAAQAPTESSLRSNSQGLCSTAIKGSTLALKMDRDSHGASGSVGSIAPRLQASCCMAQGSGSWAEPCETFPHQTPRPRNMEKCDLSTFLLWRVVVAAVHGSQEGAFKTKQSVQMIDFEALQDHCSSVYTCHGSTTWSIS